MIHISEELSAEEAITRFVKIVRLQIPDLELRIVDGITDSLRSLIKTLARLGTLNGWAVAWAVPMLDAWENVGISKELDCPEKLSSKLVYQPFKTLTIILGDVAFHYDSVTMCGVSINATHLDVETASILNPEKLREDKAEINTRG